MMMAMMQAMMLMMLTNDVDNGSMTVMTLCCDGSGANVADDGGYGMLNPMKTVRAAMVEMDSVVSTDYGRFLWEPESSLLIKRGVPRPHPRINRKHRHFRGPRCQKEIPIVNSVHGIPILGSRTSNTNSIKIH